MSWEALLKNYIGNNPTPQWATQPKRTKAQRFRADINVIACGLTNTHVCLGENTKQRCAQCCPQGCAFTEKMPRLRRGLALGDAAETDKGLEI